MDKKKSKESCKIEDNITTIPDGIMDAASRGTLILFIGAGVSQIIGGPTWKQFAEKYLEHLYDHKCITYHEFANLRELNDARKILSICENISKRENITPDLKSFFEIDDKLKKKYKIYESLYDFNCIFVTTNYDDNLDLIAKTSRSQNLTISESTPRLNNKEGQGKDTKIIYLPDEFTRSNLENGNIFHLHGSMNDTQSMVITITDYMKHYKNESRPADFLEEIFKSYTVLFVGYGLEEYEILEFMINKSKHAKKDLKHFMLYPIFSREKNLFKFFEQYYADLGITLVPYPIDKNGYESLDYIIFEWAKGIGVSSRPQGFLEKIKLIDEVTSLMTKTSPFKENNVFKENDLLELIKKDTLYENYFFKKVWDIKWFYPLKEKDYFSPDKAPDSKPSEKEGYSSFPYWNVLPYLERVSEKTKLSENKKDIDELLNIIKNVTKYHIDNSKRLDNFYTWQSFAKILVNIPNNKISIDIIDLIPIWLDTKFDNILVPIEILKNLLPKFLDSDNSEDLKKAEKIIDITTGIKPIYYTKQEKQKINEKYKYILDKPEEQRTEVEKAAISLSNTGIKEFTTIVDGYILNEKFLAQKKANEVGEKCSEQIIYTLADRIKQIIQNEYPDKDYDISYIWIKSLFENSEYSLPAKTIITLILRDIIIAKAKKDKKTSRGILHTFLKKYNRPLFKRVTLLVIGIEWKSYNDIFWKMIDEDKNSELFNNPHYKSEMYILLQNNVSNFSKKQKEKIKNIIEKKVPKIEYSEEEYKERYYAYQKQEWYSAVKSDDYFKISYEKCREITGVEEEISFKPEARLGFGESPQTEEEIMKMSNKELALYLMTFKTVDFWKGPTVRGLAEAMKNMAASHPEKFTDDLEPLLKTEYLYISNILWGIAQALKNEKEINWGRLFSFIHKYINLDDFWDDKYKIKASGDILPSHMDENHLSVIRAVSNLIREGTRYELYPFLDEHFVLAQKIIFLILDKLIPQKNKINDEPYHDNFLSNASNSIFGTVTEALVSLIFKVAQTGKNTGKEQTIKLGEELINKYEEILEEEITEGYFWFGAYLLNFYHANKKWTENRIKSIDVKHLFWEPFMSGYLLLSGSIDKDLYNLMRNNYLESINYDFKTKETREMLVQHICVEYLNSVEEINVVDSLFKKLLDKWNRFLIGEIIRFFWIQRDYLVTALQNQNMDNINKAKERIIDFWRWVYKKNKYKAGRNILKKEDEEILSELSMLTVFLSKIDSENCEWLELSAQYVTNIDISFFIEYLNKIKDKENSVDYLGDIFLKILEKNTPTFRQEDIVSIVEFLYTKNKKREADEICNEYGKKGFDFLNNIHEKQ